jgi:hypothetical protein
MADETVYRGLGVIQAATERAVLVLLDDADDEDPGLWFPRSVLEDSECDLAEGDTIEVLLVAKRFARKEGLA